MNGLFLACKVETPYTVVLKNLPLVVPANTSFVIRVFGLSQPATFYPGATAVFVGLTNLLPTARTFEESGEIFDQLPNPAPGNVVVRALSIND